VTSSKTSRARLCEACIAALPAAIARPVYDRSEARGIVHFGIGAFHRAHMAAYTDACLNAGERDWLITGVSLRSGGVAAQMNPQDGLFTLTERSGVGDSTRLIGAVRDVLVATQQGAEVAKALIAPQTRIISFTITEKGYCRAPDGSLDLALAGKGSFYPLLAEAFRERKRAGAAGLTLLSCDNLAENGVQLARLMGEYLAATAPDISEWFENRCCCPSTMVDRIVPATTDEDRARIAATLGLADEAAVITEAFSQWVIEDNFAGSRPRWEDHGAQLVADVRPFETAKLRMLNGAHSLLAYCGLAAGHNFVHEAIADPRLRALAERLMREEAAPSIAAGPEQDLAAYAESLIARFANPALNHRLIQIAMDGSQKIPQRWLETLAWNQRAGRRCPAILEAIAGWLLHIRGDNGSVDDPLAQQLSACWRAHGDSGILAAIFGPGAPLASHWQPDAEDATAIAAALSRLETRSAVG
jgi:fructuronate reductase